jgi:hypothetical protein
MGGLREDERATMVSKRSGFSMRSGRNNAILPGKYDLTSGIHPLSPAAKTIDVVINELPGEDGDAA